MKILIMLSFLIFAGPVLANEPAPEVVQGPAIAETVPVAPPAAPPKWAEQLIVQLEAMPVVGPVVTKIVVWLGIISAILTSFIAFLLTALNLLKGVLNIAGLVQLVDKIEEFKNGKIMYWLKYLSMFNSSKSGKP